jgi:hypothetical protein
MARKVLIRGCEKVGGYDYSTWKEDGGWSLELGYGRINAYNSLIYGASSIHEQGEGFQILVETHAGQYIISTRDKETLDFTLIDLAGKVVMIGKNQQILKISHKGLSKGVYALRLNVKNNIEVIKLLIP